MGAVQGSDGRVGGGWEPGKNKIKSNYRKMSSDKEEQSSRADERHWRRWQENGTEK